MDSSYVSIGSAEDSALRAKNAVKSAASSASVRARAAADSTTRALRDLVGSEAPPVTIDLTPFKRGAGMTLVERFTYAKGQVRPWREFASARWFSLPEGFIEVKPRFIQNLNKFFYNYAAIALFDLAISGVLHRFDAVVTLALIAILFVAFEEDIVLFNNNRLTIGNRVKSAIVALAALYTFIFGGIIPFIFRSIVLAFLAYVVHGFIRETSEEQNEVDMLAPAASPEDQMTYDVPADSPEDAA